MSFSGEVYLHCRMIDVAPFNMYTKAGYSIVKTDSILILLMLQRRKHLMCKKLPAIRIPSDMSDSVVEWTSWIDMWIRRYIYEVHAVAGMCYRIFLCNFHFSLLSLRYPHTHTRTHAYEFILYILVTSFNLISWLFLVRSFCKLCLWWLDIWIMSCYIVLYSLMGLLLFLLSRI
jgi:hypothetical protein